MDSPRIISRIVVLTSSVTAYHRLRARWLRGTAIIGRTEGVSGRNSELYLRYRWAYFL